MFLNSTFAAIEAEAHRAALIADARNYRLARLVRAARRRERTARTTAAPPGPGIATGTNVDADRRYAVSR